MSVVQRLEIGVFLLEPRALIMLAGEKQLQKYTQETNLHVGKDTK